MKWGTFLSALALTGCASTAEKAPDRNELAFQQQPAEYSLIFGTRDVGKNWKTPCKEVEGLSCFPIDSFQPFYYPETEAELIRRFQYMDGEFIAADLWSAGDYEFFLSHRREGFLGLDGEFYWVMTSFNSETVESEPISVTIFSYEHGVVINMPVREVMGVDAPLIVPTPNMSFYEYD